MNKKLMIDRELLERLETWVTDDCEALHELQAILAAPEAENACLRAGQEPVAAQVRFRRPEKGLADWSVWQQTTIKPNMPAWSIDSAGYEVEYRLLYTTPQPSAVPDIAGWLWHWLMDYCKKNSQPPATRNDLFAVVSDLHKMLAAAPSAPTTVQSDADNYRWLRDQHNNVNSDIGVYDGANILATSDGELDLDAAIAAARQEGGE